MDNENENEVVVMIDSYDIRNLEQLANSIDKQYTDLYKTFVEMGQWNKVVNIIGYKPLMGDELDVFVDKLTRNPRLVFNYIAENEHLHEEWILKIKMKLL